jgi:GT2 family glycosyltransferase/glycosyltransferase involved in cell wall biosynthesis
LSSAEGQATDLPGSTSIRLAPLVLGNRAQRHAQWAQACALYLQAVQEQPGAAWIKDNLKLLAQQYRRRPRCDGGLSVGVCGWELSHNAAGRVQMLADLYGTFANVELLGCHFPKWGRSLWSPLVPSRFPVHSFVVDDESSFMPLAMALVAAHPYDVVHLSKPRAPTLFIGLLYKLLWRAQVLVDVDDEELAFVGGLDALSIDAVFQAEVGLPPLQALAGADWTRLAVGLVDAFDGVTVSNPALQQRYGGQLLRHARDQSLFDRAAVARAASRARFGIEAGKKVVLFFGTPRAHKGLVETAEAIAQLPSRDVVFVVAGDFPDAALMQRLLQVPGCDTRLLGAQPYADIAQVVALADACVLLQQPGALVADFQAPAKLSDALAMGVPVLSRRTPPLAEFIDAGAVVEVGPDGLAADLWRLLSDDAFRNRQSAQALAVFQQKLSFPVNAQVLKDVITATHLAGRSREWAWPDPSILATSNPPPRLEDLLAPAFYAQHAPQAVSTAGVEAPPTVSPAAAPAVATQLQAAQTIHHTGPFAVVCHVFYLEIWPDLLAVIQRLPRDVAVYITTPAQTAGAVRQAVAATVPHAQVVACPNQGMDIVPFLTLLPQLAAQGCQAVLKLHTKRGRGAAGARWRHWMLDTLGASTGNLQAVMQAFLADPALALVGPGALYLSVRKLAYDNAAEVDRLLQALGLPLSQQDEAGFFAGSMFWCRVQKLLPLAQLVIAGGRPDAPGGAPGVANGLDPSEHPGDAVATDGRFEHALERAIGPVALAGSAKVGLLHPSLAAAGEATAVLVADPVHQVPVGLAHVGQVLRQLFTLQQDAAALRVGAPFFDAALYRSGCEDLGRSGADLVTHYLTRGAWQGWCPAPAGPDEDAARAHLRACGSHRNPLAFLADLRGDTALLALLRKRPDQAVCRFTLARSGLFDEAHYRAQLDPDEAMEGDAICHYLANGVCRGLWPHPAFDPLAYWAANRDVLDAGVEPFFHYLSAGALDDRPRRPAAMGGATSASQPDAMRWVVLNRMRIDWRQLAAKTVRKPLVSVVIPVLDQPALTRACLESLVTTDAGSAFEIVCVDNGSGPETALVLAQFQQAHSAQFRIVTLAFNHQFALGCNLGFAQASGEVVVFLNNDTTVTPGWLGALVRPLQDPAVVAVQPRLLFPDGTVQCAGVVFSDRQDLGYPLYAGKPGDEACVNHARDLQAVTAACMALRAADFARCKGFDPLFINGQEDVDLCLRLGAAPGQLCRYEPASTVLHHEGRSANRYAHARANRRAFIDRWRGRIRADDSQHYAADGFTVDSYQADSAANEALGVAVYRPLLASAAP